MPDLISEIRSLLNAHPGGGVHLMGIGGVGMAGLAGALQQRGYRVDGCDLASNVFTDRLTAGGVPVLIGHDVAHLDAEPFMLIRSTAVPESHSEVRSAVERGIPVFRRGEVFPALLQSGTSVAVSGTHGKTTTSALCVHAVRGAGQDPSYFVGGEWEGAGRVFGAGADPLTIVEADESDGTLAHYRPDIAVITGIDYDHMEHFTDEQAFIRIFERFIAHTRTAIVYGRDDARLSALIPAAVSAISYGFSPDARVRGESVREHEQGAAFTVVVDGTVMGDYSLPVHGMHNIQNALAALAVTHQLGLSVARAGRALATFRPVRRRFERVAVWRGIPVYSDYAHHPTAIKALVKSAKHLTPRRLLAIFQPHRYTRTRALGLAFPSAFEGVDQVILAPVYAASEQPLEGGHIADLEAHFRSHGGVPFQAARDLDDAWSLFEEMAEPGDILLLIGAGDIERLGRAAASATSGE